MAAKRERTLPPEMDAAIYNLRVAGVSERGIYETLRDTTETLVSYRDLRASFARTGVPTKAMATQARKTAAFNNDDHSERPMKQSDYLRRYEITRQRTRGDLRAEAKDDLDRAYTLGYLARAGVDPSVIDEKALRDSLISIYKGEGSP